MNRCTGCAAPATPPNRLCPGCRRVWLMASAERIAREVNVPAKVAEGMMEEVDDAEDA